MNSKRSSTFTSRFRIAMVACVLLFTSSVVNAAPGEISDIPLTLGNKPKPNVLFVIDDSGSMENEVLQRKGVSSVYSDNRKDSTGANNGNLDMTPDKDKEFLELCAGYNVLAYDPRNTYEAWPGMNDVDVSVANPMAPSYPHGKDWSNNTGTDYRAGGGGNGGDNPRGGAKLALNNSKVGYVVWTDTGSNPGEFDNGECGNDSNKNTDSIKDLKKTFVSFPSMTAAEKQNFANWYTYHRKRRFLITSPMLNVIENVDMRVGIATINNASDVGEEVEDISESNNRAELRTAVLELGSSSSTPLRRPLDNAGRYYKGETVDSGFVGSSNPGSPILSEAEGGACQQNYAMLMTDGYSNEGGNQPRTNVGNADSGGAGDGNNSAFDGGPYGDTYSNTLGDIAMYYYENDLSPGAGGLDDKVESNDPNDTNSAQHMVTYTVAFGVTANLTWPPPTETPYANWPNASSDPDFWKGEKTASLDDLIHAAFNGRGKFLSALNGNELNDSIQEVVSNIKANTAGSGASVSFSAANIAVDTLLFETKFSSEFWSGTLDAFYFSFGAKIYCPTNNDLSCPKSADVGSCNVACVTAKKEFSADELLKARVADPGRGANSRVIISYNGTKGVPFRFPVDYANPTAGELSTPQVDDLLVNVGASDKQVFGGEIVDFLRGDQTLANGNQFRDRGGFVLGDLIESIPQYVGPPSANYPNLIEGIGKEYETFAVSQQSRKEVVYAGANDGMLHGFNARTGEELLAYIPGQLFSTEASAGLHYLADPGYVHKSYVDGTPTIADVFVGNKWRTYLVGTYGVGGKGVYVLDVTDPSAFSEANAANIVKMEYTHPELGLGFSRPQIVRMNNGKWAAVFGNGYGGSGGDGKAKLFILYLDGSTPKIIDTAEGSIVGGDCLNASSDCNGLSTPTVVDFNRDSNADRIYAGDLHGNMWAFDVSSTVETGWNIAHKNGLSLVPMFVACSAALVSQRCPEGKRQPITTKPSVRGQKSVRGTLTRPNTIVLFGTGQSLTKSDVANQTVQSFYGVWDAGAAHGETSRVNLVEQTFGVTTVGSQTDVRSLSRNAVNYSAAVTGKFGWYFDLPDTGERVTVDPILGREIVIITSSTPNTDICGPGGSGFLMAADIFSGGLPSFQVFDGAPSQSAVALETSVEGNAFIDGTSISQLSDGQQSPNSVDDSGPSQSRRINWSIIQ